MATKIVTKNSSTASAVPTASDLVQGELAVNVADKRLFTEDNAGAIVELGTNPSGNVTFQDNGKAIFGAGSDLQIYHDGSDSYITDTTGGNFFINDDGAGYLMMKGSDLYFRNTSSADMIHAQSGGFVKLYHNGSEKLATTSTGIDVTGTATMDGLTSTTSSSMTQLTVNGTGAIESGINFANGGTTYGQIYFNNVSPYDMSVLQQYSTGSLIFGTNDTERMRIDSSGNVGIGLTNPSDYYAENLVVAAPAEGGITIKSASTDQAYLMFADGTSGSDSYRGYIGHNHSTDATSLVSFGTIDLSSVAETVFTTASTERMRIDSSGNVGIGISIPNRKVVINDAADAYTLELRQDSAYNSGNQTGILFGAKYNVAGSNADVASIRGGKENTTDGDFGGKLAFYTRANGGSDTERMRIDSSGNLLVGTSSVSAGLSSGKFVVGFAGNIANGIKVYDSYASAATNNAVVFIRGSSEVGSITTTTSATAYNTSSDQRLKENIADADDAGSKIDAIQVRKYDWKVDGSHQDYGMIAQELQTVAPEAVSGDADSEEMMGVDYSKLVPMLIKEIQSLRNRVAQLEE